MPQPSSYARRQNRLRQKHPDVVDFRLGEATRYENYERHLLARNYNANAKPRYMQHFDQAPHKLHMVSACIEQVTRAVEDIQQQQLNRAEAAGGVGFPSSTSGRNSNNNQNQNNNNQLQSTSYTLEQNMKGIGTRSAPGSSSSSRFRGPSTTAKLFLPEGAETIGESMNPDYRHNSKSAVDNNDNDDDYDDEEAQQKKLIAARGLTAAEIVSGRSLGSSSRNSHRRKSKNSNTSSGRSPSPKSPVPGEDGNHDNTKRSNSNSPINNNRNNHRSPSKSSNNQNTSTAGFFAGFDDPTKKFRFKPVDLAEALADPPVHPLPRPPLFSRPCKGQTVVVGGDIRLVGKNVNASSDPLSEPKAAAQAAVARDPKMLAVRIAVEQNPLHEAIEQMRQVTAAMAVKTYNAVNTMNTIMKHAERDEKEMNEVQSKMFPELAAASNKNNHNNNSPLSSGRSYSPPTSARSAQSNSIYHENDQNLSQLARGRRLRDPQALSKNYRQQQLDQQKNNNKTSKPPSASARLPISNFNLAQKQKQQQEAAQTARLKLSTPQRQRAMEDLVIHQGKHLGDESIIASKPPTRESRIVPNNHSPSSSVRPLGGHQPQHTVHESDGVSAPPVASFVASSENNQNKNFETVQVSPLEIGGGAKSNAKSPSTSRKTSPAPHSSSSSAKKNKPPVLIPSPPSRKKAVVDKEETKKKEEKVEEEEENKKTEEVAVEVEVEEQKQPEEEAVEEEKEEMNQEETAAPGVEQNEETQKEEQPEAEAVEPANEEEEEQQAPPQDQEQPEAETEVTEEAVEE